MLTRKTPAFLATTVTLTGQGAEPVTFNVTFNNHKQQDVFEFTQANANNPEKTILFIVNAWEAEYELTAEGVLEAESDRPGLIVGLLSAFYESRKVEVRKN